MISSIFEVRACPECSGSNLSYIEDREQVVCRDCGLVYEPLTPADEDRLERMAGMKSSQASKPKKGKPGKKPVKAKKPVKKSKKR